MPDKGMSNHPGTIECMFCSSVISFRSGDNHKFKTHMEVHHEVFSSFDILLGLHFLRREETENILEQVRPRVEEVMIVGLQVKQEMMNILDAEFDISYDSKKQKEEEKASENREEKLD